MTRAHVFHRVRGWRRVAELGVRVAAAWLLWAIPSAALGPGAAPSDAQRASEYDVKAAYLLNFGKFIRSNPTSSQQRNTFDICIVGPDPMGRVLDSLAAGEDIEGRPVRIRRMNEAGDARACDIAYLSTSDSARVDSQLAALRNSDVLTVGDSPEFLQHGGMIQFVLVAQHVRFSVNLNAVRQTHLVLSSELLRVAFSIVGKAGGEVQP